MNKSDGVTVLTGGTSGFGYHALEMASRESTRRFVVGARGQPRNNVFSRSNVEMLPLDLSSMRSVKSFAKAVGEFGPIDSLVLNAGLSPRSLKTTEDELDQAFQVNYFSHFALTQWLSDQLRKDAHIVITSSGTHDPEENTPPPPPRHADLGKLADPNSDPDLDRLGARAASRSYTASKLCCTMLSIELAQRRPQGTSISFDPGLVPGTRLTREFPQLLVRLIMPVMSRSMPSDRTSSIDASANALAYLMARRSLVGSNGDYVAMRGGYPIVVEPSELARDDSARERLWNDSIALLDEKRLA